MMQNLLFGPDSRKIVFLTWIWMDADEASEGAVSCRPALVPFLPSLCGGEVSGSGKDFAAGEARTKCVNSEFKAG